jgi:hypothetical protein
VKALIESRPDQRNCDAYPHLEAVTISKQIEQAGWRLAQPLHLFYFFQNLSYLVILYATIDSQSQRKSPNREGVDKILHRPERLRCIPYLEAVTISKQIELEDWGLAQPLHLFKFFQNLPYLVHLYAAGDSQSHRKSPNPEGVNTIFSSFFLFCCLLAIFGQNRSPMMAHGVTI